MAPGVERREHRHRASSDRSRSPVKNRHSPRRRTSPRRERTPPPRKSSPRAKSPIRKSRGRSPAKEYVPDRVRSPKHARQQSPAKDGRSRSPSPQTKRLRRVHTDREAEKIGDRERRRNSGREDYDKERHKEREEIKDVSRDRTSLREKNDGGSSKSSRHDHSDSIEEQREKRRYHSRSRSRSHSPTRVSRAGERDEMKMKPKASEYTWGSENDSLAKMKEAEQALEAKEKQKPSFELSGKLAEETNKVRGVALLFNEPPDARKPDIRWRLYVFKAGEALNDPLFVHRQSCYLFGRERKVADIPTDHPSCSKQHAVIQYRLVEKEQPDGLISKQPGICTIA
ncbi:FHA domain-containing protein DDL [Canna indica]|uniref:FHA domain-containing protein DDL n=1 Tax=Canna indica TaxID=4628 RepID=A0AAQ3QQH2_9LILI|nr:FHA domain-containing protein DDL [Canna indica]